MAGSNRKKARKSKSSAGVNGGGGKLRTPLTDVQKVLLGGGLFRSRPPMGRVAPSFKD